MSTCYRPIEVFVKTAGHAYLFPCGRCASCLNRRKQQWIHRIQAENMYSTFKYKYFVTLSYQDKYLPFISRKSVHSEVISTGESLLNPLDLRNFIERFRHLMPGKFSYFACGEYGKPQFTQRPHYHLCIFCNTDWQTTLNKVNLAWSYLRAESRVARYQRLKRDPSSKYDHDNMLNRDLIGRTQVKSLSYRRMSYIAKYVNKQFGDDDKAVPCFYRCSNGLGKSFLSSQEAALLSAGNIHYSHLESGMPCSISHSFVP